MGKRLREDPVQALVSPRDDSPSKKQKKDKSLSEIEVNDEHQTARKEKKEKDKKKKKVKNRKAQEQQEETVAQPEDSEALDKAARKAAKAARKEARALSAQQSDLSAPEDIDKEVRRKAKKEAKAAAKAAIAANGDSHSSNAATVEATQAATRLTEESSVPSEGYVESTALAGLPQTEVDAFLSEQMIHVEAGSTKVLRPILNFTHLPKGLGISDEMFKGFKTPTPIQAAAWPYLLSGKDAIGVAQTGSGKTIAFGVPCVRYVSRAIETQGKRGRTGVKAVVVSPTRELAQQIHEQYVKMATSSKVKVVCLYGGVPKDAQRNDLAQAHVIIATPGRLNDFIQEGAADLSNVGFLVLDEADRMLEKGFEEEVRKIIGATPNSGRQTLMFTATWPPTVRELASTFMSNPVKITVGDNPTGELRANTRIKQEVEVLDPRQKTQRLMALLGKYQSGKNKNDRILVFCLYKKEAARVEADIRMRGFRVAGIHGDMGQTQRMQSLESFKNGSVPLLVATDVAARGLDIPAVKVVINVTFPLTVEDYVHRIGRTGRAGADGLAITLFTEHDKNLSGGLINVLKAANQPVPDELLKFGTTVKKKTHDVYGAFYKNTDGMAKATKITFDD